MVGYRENPVHLIGRHLREGPRKMETLKNASETRLVVLRIPEALVRASVPGHVEAYELSRTDRKEDPYQKVGPVHESLMRLLQDTSDQLVQFRE